jgi:hypothetical protein
MPVTYTFLTQFHISYSIYISNGRDQCYRLHAQHTHDLVQIPAKGRKNAQALLTWIVNLPYQSDVLWWFNEVARREQVVVVVEVII